MNRKKTRAVALRYEGDDQAPMVVAKGEGYVARQIIKTAQQHNIPLQQNEELTSMLSKVRLHQEIPENLYAAVAQLLVYLYYLDGKPTNN